MVPKKTSAASKPEPFDEKYQIKGELFENVSDKKLLDIVKRQTKDLKNREWMRCICGDVIGIAWMYKCFYCGLWFCPDCAEDHFSEEYGDIND